MNQIDLKIFYFFNNLADQNKWLDYFFIFLTDYFQYFIGLAFLLIILISKNSKKEKAGWITFALSSVIAARLVVAEIIRFFIHRPRPFLTHTVYQLVQESSYSFPSGHAIFFFAFAMAVYFYNKKLGILYFIFAALISISRLIVGVHYPSDILAGAILGIIITAILEIFFKKYFFQKKEEALLPPR